MPKGTPSLLYSAPCEAGFDAEKFLSLAHSVFSNVSAGDGRIRSGRHIPRGFKNLVSSYKIIASHTPLMGGGRIDVAVVKLCPGAELTPEKEESVVRFVEEERAFFEPLHPSFFELATALALKYFADAQVDVAVIEVGLGGRLDCTNIICPDVSLVTNISLDHTQFLGNTLAQIAGEKAGIFKEGVPAVVGETTPETRPVFEQKARDARVASLHFAEDENHEADYPCLEYELKGLYQEKNRRTLLTVLPILREAGYRFTEADVRRGFAHVTELTGLMGRWQRLREWPTVVCDTGHNVGGMAYLARQLRAQHCRRLRIVLGMVNDKDVRGVLALLPQEADYYFAQASVRRALPATEMARLGHEAGLRGSAWPDVPAAVRAALKESLPEDFIFVGGSTFVVADLLANRDALNLY